MMKQNQNMMKQNYCDELENEGRKASQKKDSMIASNENQNDIELPFLTGLLGVAILILSTLMSLIVTMWPQHNSILNPKYWYEGLGIWTFGQNLIFSVSVVFERNKIIGTDQMLSWKAIVQAFFSLGTSFMIIYTTVYLTWTHGLEYCPPMPHIGVLCYVAHGLIFWPVSIWFLFPSNMRDGCTSSRKKILWYICLMMLRSLMAASYTKVTLLLLIESEHIGPRELLGLYLGILLPLIKKFNTWWYRKIALRILGSENELVDFGSIIVVGYLHSFSLALLLGSSEINGLTYTKYLLIVGDCIFNTWTLFSILRLHKKVSDEQKKMKIIALKCLALKEFLRILVPAVYFFSFIIAYYGPNADVIGNVKNDYWQFEKASDLLKKFQNILIVFVIDACRGVLFGVILWIFCGLNMFTAYCYVVRHYGVFILFFGSAVINGVKCIPYCFIPIDPLCLIYSSLQEIFSLSKEIILQ